MQLSFIDRVKRGYNAFRDKDPTNMYPYNIGPSSSIPPSRTRFNIGTERSTVSSIYNRIGIDVSSIAIRHVRVDQNGRYIGMVDSDLNNCLSLQANVDQTGRAFIQDAVQSMCDEGCVALVAVDTTSNPSLGGAGSYDVQSLRTAKILEWYPYHVRLNLYNEQRGIKEDIVLAKRDVVIIENPLYAVMNEPNSTLKRLVSKLNLLDTIDNQSGSGKLDLIIQLPYVIKTEARRNQAEIRRKDIEAQLSGSKYGIAYTDGTERITQLNRPVENNLMTQIEYLTSMLHSQLGLTESIFDGTADEKTMINYYNRTVEPILASISDGMRSKFITKTGRSQGQTIAYFRDPFKLVPTTELANMADSFTRNAILSTNEFRSIIGYKPSQDPEADKLVNKNLNPSRTIPPAEGVPTDGAEVVNNFTKGAM